MSLRLLGFGMPATVSRTNEPLTHRPDDKLGWTHITGDFNIPPYSDVGDFTKLTIDQNGYRVTKTKPSIEYREKILLIGGSFTLGWGLNDDQTMGWKLQQALSRYDVLNKGVGGYGGYQALMTLENEINKKQLPKIVLYGFIEHHKFRNVGETNWLESLQNASRSKDLRTPYLSLDHNRLIKHEPIDYKKPWLAKNLVSAHMAFMAYHKIKTRKRVRVANEISNLTIKQMDSISQANDADFYVLLLRVWGEESKQKQIEYLKANNIKYIDCHVPLTDKNTIKGDGHPDGSVNSIWAERVIKQLLADSIPTKTSL